MTYQELVDILGPAFSKHAKHWGAKQGYDQWELIEMLSKYHGINDYDIGIDIKLSTDIAQHIQNKTSMSWADHQLSLGDKSLIIKLLNDQGIDILFDRLDPFPTNVDEFVKITKIKPIRDRLRIKFNIFLIYFMRYKFLIEIMGVLLGLVLLDHHLLLSSLLFTWAIFSPIYLLKHEDWSHGYIQPKNKIITLICQILTFVYAKAIIDYQPIVRKQHMMHHAHWKDLNLDYHQYSLSIGNLGHLFHINGHRTAKIIDKYQLPESTQSIISKFGLLITLLIYLFILIVFGVDIFFYFFFFPSIVMQFIETLVGEVLAHGFTDTADNEYDLIFLLPMIGNLANHVSHHRAVARVCWGSVKYPWLRYINPQFYVYKLLFKDVK